MYRALRILVLFLLLSVQAFGQVTPAYIQQNALSLSSPTALNKEIYEVLKEYKAILVGEMHGTQEPAEFVTGLAKLFSIHGKQLLIGVEVSEEVLGDFPKALSKEALSQSFFFTKGYGDGRNNSAWANMLLATAGLPNVSFVFYDLSSEQETDFHKRDSLMYVNINKALKKNPGAVFISISGRLHSLTKPLEYITPLGYYLKEDEDSALKNQKILSVRHLYSGGSMYNATMDDGLAVRKADASEAGLFSSAAPADQYFLLLPTDTGGYNSIFFTRKVTASTEWIQR